MRTIKQMDKLKELMLTVKRNYGYQYVSTAVAYCHPFHVCSDLGCLMLYSVISSGVTQINRSCAINWTYQ